jgi:hypothetical protein
MTPQRKLSRESGRGGRANDRREVQASCSISIAGSVRSVDPLPFKQRRRGAKDKTSRLKLQAMFEPCMPAGEQVVFAGHLEPFLFPAEASRQISLDFPASLDFVLTSLQEKRSRRLRKLAKLQRQNSQRYGCAPSRNSSSVRCGAM